MTETPQNVAAGLLPGETPAELQDHAILQMQTLLSLLATFTETLPAISTHRKLLESAAGVIKWYGYIRDTSVAVMHNRKCNLNSVQWSSVASTEAYSHSAVETLCKLAAAKIIQLDRDVVHLRDRDSAVNSEDARIAALQASCNLIESFNNAEGAILEEILSGGSALSLQMEGCIGTYLRGGLTLG